MADQDEPIVIDLTTIDYPTVSKLAASIDYAALARTAAQISAFDLNRLEASVRDMKKRSQQFHTAFFNFDAGKLDKQIAIASKFRLAFINSGISSERASQIEIPKAAPAKKSKKQSLVVPVRQAEIVVAHYSLYPPQPENEGWDAVFDWYHSIPRYLCQGFAALSKMIGKPEDTVRKKHMDYRSQYGVYPIGYWDDKK